MPTIKDVARVTNFSTTTVWRVLQNDQTLSVTDETRNKIIAAASQLNYRPLRKKKGAVDKKTANVKIGVLIWCSPEVEYEDPYFLSIRQGLEMRFSELDLTLSQIYRLGAQEPDGNLNELDGLIVIGAIDPSEVERIYSRPERIVFVNCCPDSDKYDSVVTDFEQALALVMNHFFALGYRDIGFVGGDEFIHRFGFEKIQVKESRRIAFERIAKEKGIFNPERMFQSDWSTMGGYHTVKDMVQQGNLPRAIFFASDPMAIGALKALHEVGVSVPSEVAIIGFDDIEMASFARVPLTTVKIYTEQMGRTAVDMVLQRIQGRDVPLKSVVPSRLVVRESCGGT
ncbi:LacI family DNA-binding transcriptional regulator [Paenibacillus ehimensis]|uniref:LacI family DNA-binding transcriptional regulator n=1 Tax=Paenibacillus ehimensis TaxID=79264 RepID=A0ABT8V4A3_9BACL|nr:LacI family DNA-binding transcriptional regulator [Paenibacillus ehimensis]MDO3676268.1 LacI family DNA-binding transcriptional regulator [Paenibacillus ehimensis]MEC0210051.1 LacI family DNA-binding transcriptional regulator [Paenibacillus ehimensis]